MHKHTAFPTIRDVDGMAVIGRTTRDLRGIRFGEGEAGNTPPAGEQPPGQSPAAPPVSAAAPPAPPAPHSAPPTAPPVNYRGDPDEYVRELREEAKNHRLAAEKAANDFAAAQAERDAAAAERDRLSRENKLILAAPKLGANPELLLDSSSFMKTFADVDLADEAAVKKAIEDAIERNAAFKSGPALPTTSGGGHQGGTPPATPLTLDGAVKSALGG